MAQKDGSDGTKVPEESPIVKAIRLAGGPTALARALRARGHTKVNSHATVTQWVANGSVPSRYCPDIEDLTGVRCEDLDGLTNWRLVRSKPAQGVSAQGVS